MTVSKLDPAPLKNPGEDRAKAELAHYARMTTKRDNFQQTWKEVSLYVVPDKDGVFGHSTKGEEKHRHLYDGYAEHCVELLSAALHSMLTNPTTQWFFFTSGQLEMDRQPEVQKYLGDFSRQVLGILNNSNFQSEVHEVFMDLCSFGTSALRIMEDDEDTLRFHARPIYELVIAENHLGIVDYVGTEDEMDVRQALQQFGEKAFGEHANKLRADLTKCIKIHHIVRPRRKDETKGTKGPNSSPYISLHIYKEANLILQEEAFYTFPWIVPRWVKRTGEAYGRSPAMKALPDIRMRNTMQKFYIRGVQKMVDPPWIAPEDSIMGDLDLTPGSVSSVRPGMADQIRPLISGGRPEVGKDLLEMNKETIKAFFFIDQLQLRDGPQMTATEVNTLVQQHLRLLGPILGRLNYEFLKLMMVRIVDIMKRKNLIPTPPRELADKNPQVFFASEIAKAQLMGEADTINRFMGIISGLVAIDPSVYDLLDSEKFVNYMANLYGVTREIFRSKAEVKQVQAARAEAQNKAVQGEENLIQAETMQKGAAGVKALKESA